MAWDSREARGSRVLAWLETPAVALLVLFVLGLLPRLALLVFGGRSLETWEYESLGVSVANGNGYLIARNGHPILAFGDGNLYSFLSAATYMVAGHWPLVLATLQVVLASLAAPVLFTLARPVFGPRVALLGAALAAVHPGLVAYSIKLHALNVDILLLAILVLVLARRGGGVGDAWWVGLVLGVSLMSRPTFYVAGLAGLSARLLLRRGSLGPAALAVAISLAIAAPWIARNWAVLGQPVFTTTSYEDLWKGSHPLASGSGYLASGQTVFEAAPEEFRARLVQSDELGQDALYREAFLDFVQAHPGAFATLMAQKAFYFWWFPPQAGLFYPAAWLTAYTAYYGVVLALAALGAGAIVIAGRREERELLFLVAAVFLAITAIHAVAYVEGRHRWGIEPVLLLLSARGVEVLVRRALGGRGATVRQADGGWPQAAPPKTS